MKTRLSLLFAVFFISAIFSQEKKDIGTAYADYFALNREIPYLHLNKTSFINGENIWFQAYVLNQKTAELNQQTSNLYCTLYDKNGNYKTSKLLLVENGIAAGNFKIDSTFTDNTYYIKAATNWMRNFKEDNSFLQKITIASNQKNVKKPNNQTTSYDLQLFAEGGHFVEGVKGTIGLVIKDENGTGVQLKSAELIDQNNKVIAKLRTNFFGLGMAHFIYQNNTKYKLRIETIDGVKMIKNIPKAEKTGLVLNVTNPNAGFINVSLRTNPQTLKKFNGANYNIYIHNTRSISKRTIGLRADVFNYDLMIPAKKLLKGINIITVTNEMNTPLLERVIFNYDKSLFENTAIDIVSKKQDSISLTFTKEEEAVQFLSISVLPEQTISYHPTNTIFSEFLLKPFVRGNIENSNYYFTDPTRKKLADLDLLLLTQGWSKYQWEDVFNHPPTIKYSFEKGISIQATITSSKQKDSTKLALISSKRKLFLTEPIINNKANFNNIYLQENDTISYTIIRPHRLKRPSIKTLITPQIVKEKILINDSNSHSQVKRFNEEEKTLNSFVFRSDFTLDELTITADNKLQNNTPIRASMSSFKVSNGQFPKTQLLISFLRTHGFKITGNYPDQVIKNLRGPASILTEQLPTTVYLDGNIIVDRFNNSLFLVSNLSLDDFDEIYLSKTFNGTIYLYSNPDSNNYKSINHFEEQTTSIGFSNQKLYYTPKYYSTTNAFFNHYGAIYWKANIEIKDNNYQLKIPTLYQKNIKLYIEGITSDGALIHQIKTINLNRPR